MEENQIRDPSCLFSPSNSVNTNSFVKANWFCTMQFPKDVFWVKLITSHNKICFNPINVRWLCLDPMCVCVFYVLYMFVRCYSFLLVLSPLFTSCQQIWHWGEWLLKIQFVYTCMCKQQWGGPLLHYSVSIYGYLFSGCYVGDFTRQGLFKSWLCPFFFVMEFLNF